MNAEERLRKARIQLNYTNPFFAYLTLHLKFKKLNTIPSCAVDRDGNFYYNENFIEKLQDEEIKGVLCHEVLHLALEHFIRQTQRDKNIWNIATDIVVNNLLLLNDFFLPDGVLKPENNEITIAFKKIKNIDKKCAEEIYDEIYTPLKKRIDEMKKLTKKLLDKHIFAGKGKNLRRGDRKGKNGKKNWKKILVEASTMAKQRGKLPVGVERLIDNLLNPKLNWKSLLHKYITSEIPFDYTWKRPHRKSVVIGIYQPSVKRELLNVTVAIDTSGSISEKELKSFLSEVISLAKSFSQIKMKFVTHDAEIQDVYEFTNGNIKKIMNIKIHGGGGTSHKPVFELAEKEKTKLLICFTDAYSDIEEIQSNIKTIFVVSSDYKLDSLKIPSKVIYLK